MRAQARWCYDACTPALTTSPTDGATRLHCIFTLPVLVLVSKYGTLGWRGLANEAMAVKANTLAPADPHAETVKPPLRNVQT